MLINEISNHNPELTQDYESFEAEFNDFRTYAREFLRIKDEHGNIIPFILNQLQEKVLKVIEELDNSGHLIWLIILKCRQTGISTLIEGYLFWRTHREFNQKCLIIGHEQEASQNLFDMYQRYYDELPKAISPKLDRNQRDKKLSYAETKNEVIIHTAGSNIGGEKAGTGRSATFQYIHATECAFYPDYLTTFTALLQASKKAKMIILETTANGFNAFRNDWVNAEEGTSDYRIVFLSWLEFYEKPFKDEDEKQALLKDLGTNTDYNEYPDEERILMTGYNATLENLHWRRWAIVNLCKKDISKFHQEYPRDDKEAFISTGRPVFKVSTCQVNYINAKPATIGELIPSYDHLNPDYRKLVAAGETSVYDLKKYIKGVEFIENPKGMIKLHTKVQQDINERYRFAGGGDVSEGLEQGDYNALKVLDRKNMTVHLTLHTHCDVDTYAEQLLFIQKYLNDDVYFAIERNNHGLAVINYAARLGVKLYYAEEFGKGFQENTDLLGFKTTVGTRTYMINNLIQAIRDEDFIDYEREAWSEALTFVKNAHGKMQAQDKDKDPGVKCYDDRIFAWIGMWVNHLWLPNFRVIQPENTEIKAILKRIQQKNKLTGRSAMSS